MVIELTDDQFAQLHASFVACAATEISILTAPKREQPALEVVAVWQRHKIENVLAEAAQQP